MRRNKWNEARISALTQFFPIETTARTAKILGMSETAVKNKAKQLCLSKLPKAEWLEKAMYVRNNFHERSYAEMARKLGVTKTTVSRIALRLGLKRTQRERSRVASRIRTEIVRRERRRIIFGLPPVTCIKMVSNRARVRLRSRMKGLGYIVGRGKRTLYYPTGVKRRMKLEKRGTKLGLDFQPLNPENDNELYNVI